MNHPSSLMQAAVVFRRLPEAQAAEVLSSLKPADRQCLLQAVGQLSDLSSEQLVECLNRFATASSQLSRNVSKVSSSETEHMRRQVDQSVATECVDVSGDGGLDKPFEFLATTTQTLRDHILGDEHPKNIAIVLSCLPPEIASDAMNGLDQNLRVSVLKRICELGEISDEQITELRSSLRQRMKKLLKSQEDDSAGVSKAADLLSCADAGTRDALLTYVGQSDPDLASKLQQKVIRVDQIELLSDSDIKTLLKHVDTSMWAPALKNGSHVLTARVLENMAEAPRALLAYEIDTMGCVSEDAEEAARNSIVKIVLRLTSEGVLDLKKKGPPQPKAAFPRVDVPVVHDIKLI
ncbi:MAG: FliG C-terminal domain-containing protein, partial [Mariniblastus sp.]|nr:FliG C-terminal domain-containing protein [Mariniblastus sp.]